MSKYRILVDFEVVETADTLAEAKAAVVRLILNGTESHLILMTKDVPFDFNVQILIKEDKDEGVRSEEAAKP